MAWVWGAIWVIAGSFYNDWWWWWSVWLALAREDCGGCGCLGQCGNAEAELVDLRC